MEIKSPANLSSRRRLSFLLKDSAIYGGAAALSKAFGLITFPVLARYFSIDDYGIIDYFTVIAGLLGALFIFGQDSAVARFFYEYDDTQQRRQVITQSFVFQLGMLVMIIPLLWLSVDIVAPLISTTASAQLLIKLILLSVPFMVLINFAQNLLKWTFMRASFLIISLGYSIVNVALILISISYFKIDVEGVFAIYLIANVLFGLIGVFFIRKWLTLSINFHYLRKLLQYGIPFGIIGVIGTFVPAMERTFVVNLVGSQELGLYAAGMKIAMLVMFIVQAFQMAWGPFSLSIFKQPDASSTYNYVLKAFTLGMCSLVLLLSAIAHPLIVLLASHKYSEASVVVFPLVMGIVIKSVSWITEIGIGISKKSYLNFYSYIAYVAVTFFSIYFFAPLFGLIGVAYGVMAGHFVKALIASLLAQRAYPLPWDYKQNASIIMITLLLGSVGSIYFSHYSYSIVLSYHIISLGVILLMGWLLLFNTSERASLNVIVKNKIKRVI